MRAAAALLALPLLAAAAAPSPLRSTPDLGKAGAQCRRVEPGPAFIVDAVGLKDRQGQLKLEVYPANPHDFLQDDNILIAAGKTFRRIEVPVPPAGPVLLCVRVPAPGPYSVVLLHDRNMNRKFDWTTDGIGFSGNPRLGWGKPEVAKTRVVAEAEPTRLQIVLNYRHGLGVAPLGARNES